MFNFIFSLILSIIDIWLIEFFLSKNFILKNGDTSRRYIYYITEIFLMVISYTLFPVNFLANFIILSLTLAIAIYRYEYTIVQFVKYLLLFIFLHMVLGSFITTMLIWTFNIHVDLSYISWSSLYKILIELIIRYVELLILLYTINKHRQSPITLHHFKSFSIFLSFYVAFVLIFNNDKLFIFPNVGRTFIFVIIVYNIALIFFDRFQTHHEELEYDHKQLKSETSSDSVYFEEHLKGNDDIRGIKHDMKNHMLVLKGYIESDSKKTALEYIQTIENEIEIASSTLHTGIPTVDSIITNKIKVMKESNIQYKEKFKVICLGDIYDRDLALMLASALDNAIEAAIKSEDKKVSLQMGTEANYLCITLINSIKRNSKPNFKKSSKEDSTKHGFGYKKIKTIVKKYDGNLDTEITRDKVIMTITLKLN